MYKIAALVLAGVFSLSQASVALADFENQLATANVDAGKTRAITCGACHSLEKGGGTRVGPNLYGVINRPVASVEGFAYSDALKAHGGEWTVERLAEYLENPSEVVPGTAMLYPGVKTPEERANVIAYLNTLSDNPLTDIGSKASNTVANVDTGLLVPGEGSVLTYYSCTSCHSEMIIAQQGKTRDGWDELLVWMVEEQGMTEPTPEDRDVILDYLAEHYNTDRPNFPR